MYFFATAHNLWNKSNWGLTVKYPRNRTSTPICKIQKIKQVPNLHVINQESGPISADN
jgi:hypothetical protein